MEEYKSLASLVIAYNKGVLTQKDLIDKVFEIGRNFGKDLSKGTITWFKCEDQLPELLEYVLVYNTEGATLIARRFEHDWRALFADGENDMKSLAPIHWAYINPPQ